MDIALIHPMLVHFPIVLFLLAMAVYAYLLVTGQDFAARTTWPYIAAGVLLAAVASAVVAAGFGDAALDIAVDKGFEDHEMEEHEELAGITIAIFSVLALAVVLAIWKQLKMTGAKAIVFFLVGLVGVGMLLNTALHGGELVYEDGVNVKTTVVSPKAMGHSHDDDDDDDEDRR